VPPVRLRNWKLIGSALLSLLRRVSHAHWLNALGLLDGRIHFWRYVGLAQSKTRGTLMFSPTVFSSLPRPQGHAAAQENLITIRRASGWRIGGRKADKWLMVVDSQLGPEYNALGHFRFSSDCINALASRSQRADGEGANLD
jgi:hypothetical protein